MNSWGLPARWSNAEDPEKRVCDLHKIHDTMVLLFLFTFISFSYPIFSLFQRRSLLCVKFLFHFYVNCFRFISFRNICVNALHGLLSFLHNNMIDTKNFILLECQRPKRASFISTQNRSAWWYIAKRWCQRPKRASFISTAFGTICTRSPDGCVNALNGLLSFLLYNNCVFLGGTCAVSTP